MSTNEAQQEGTGGLWLRVALLAAGLTQGIAAFFLVQAGSVFEAPSNGQALLVFTYAATIPLCLTLRYDTAMRDIAFSIGSGIIFALAFKAGVLLTGTESDWPQRTDPFKISRSWAMFRIFSDHFTFIVAAILFMMIVPPFYETARNNGRLVFPYDELFHCAWINKFAILIGCIFSSICTGLLWLSAGMFQTIGISALKNVLQEPLFSEPFSAAMFGLGVALARERETVLVSMLKIVLTLFRVLTPVLAAIICLFVIALIFVGTTSGGIGSMALIGILTGAAVIMLLFQNAVVQSASAAHTFARPAEWLVIAANLVLPALLGLAAWRLNTDVGGRGLTAPKFHIGVTILITFMFSAAYALSIIVKRREWRKGIVAFNPALSAAMVVIALAVNFPPFDANSFIVRDKLDRLRAGLITPSSFDFKSLRFKYGDAGRDAFAVIQKDAKLMDDPAIAYRVNEAAKAEAYRPLRGRSKKTEIPLADLFNMQEYVKMSPAGLVLPITAGKYWAAAERAYFSDCKQTALSHERKCTILSADLNGDGLDDFLTTNGQLPMRTLLQMTGENWEKGPLYIFRHKPGQRLKLDQFRQGLEAGEVETQEPDFRDVIIGGQRLLVR